MPQDFTPHSPWCYHNRSTTPFSGSTSKKMGFWTSQHVCVTGGAGFVGSHLVEILVRQGAIVRVVDNLERGRPENLHAVRDVIEFQQRDLRDLYQAQEAVAGTDIVMNMAARVTGIQYNREHHGEMFTANTLIATNTLEAARQEGVGRYLCVSTACIYPHDAIVPTPESEGDRGSPEPTNEGYGWAKRMSEKQAQYYAHEYGMEIAIVRPFNAYGPRDYYDDKTSHVIPALVKKVLGGDNPVHVWGSGNQTRAFVHDQETSIRELVEKICEMTGRSPEIHYDSSLPEGYPRRAADTTKLRAVTGGFVPKISLEEGLAQMIELFESGKAPV